MTAPTKTPERNFYRPNDFDEMHTLGVERYGEAWYTANRTVLNIARNYGLDAGRHRAFLSDVAHELCRAIANKRGAP